MRNTTWHKVCHSKLTSDFQDVIKGKRRIPLQQSERALEVAGKQCLPDKDDHANAKIM